MDVARPAICINDLLAPLKVAHDMPVRIDTPSGGKQHLRWKCTGASRHAEVGARAHLTRRDESLTTHKRAWCPVTGWARLSFHTREQKLHSARLYKAENSRQIVFVLMPEMKFYRAGRDDISRRTWPQALKSGLIPRKLQLAKDIGQWAARFVVEQSRATRPIH